MQLFPLYVKKSTTFMAHMGKNKLGIACRVEVRRLFCTVNLTSLHKVWENVLIIRRVSDNDIIMRVWRDTIATSHCDTSDQLVILRYREDRQPPVVLHTKQVGYMH